MAKMATMRAVLVILLTTSVVCAQKDPMELYTQGRYAEAARAFRKALEHDKDDARLNYNLAVTLWRQAEADEAETAAEKTATLSEGRLDALRDGVLGNLRFEAALKKAAEQTKAEPRSKILEAAVDLMVQARKHYQRGALRSGAGPALGRNLERAIRKEEELRKQLEEQKKKEEEEQKKQDQKKDKNDKDKKDQQKKDQDKKDQQKKDQQNKDQQQPKQPKQQPLPKFDPKKQLTKEQKKRLLEKLKQIEAQLRELQKQKKAGRPKVKKDW